MRLPAMFALGVFVLSCGGGGGSPTSIPQADACRQGSQSVCTKLFMCNDQSLVLVRAFLVSEPACETTIQQMYCAPFSCTAGQTYHGDKAQQCKVDFAATSCATLATAAASLNLANFGSAATILAGSVPVCQQICTAGDDGGAATGG